MNSNKLATSRKVLTTLICCDIVTAALRNIGSINSADRTTVANIVYKKFTDTVNQKAKKGEL